MTAGSSIRRARQSLAGEEVDAGRDVDAGLDSDVDPEVAAESPVEVDGVSDAFDDPSPSEPFSPSFEDVPVFTAARRSFFAHPDPLKWIAGGANAFRTGPEPHSGHAAGGASWTPWMTSNRRPHAAQS
jgi:hypothetical protein